MIAPSQAHREMLGRAARFFFVAVLNNALGYALFIFLLWCGLSVPAAVAIGYVVSIGLSYVANSKYSFRAAYGSPRQFAAYVALYLFCYAANVAALKLAGEYFGIPAQLTQIVLVFVFGGLIFLVLHYFIFAAKRTP